MKIRMKKLSLAVLFLSVLLVLTIKIWLPMLGTCLLVEDNIRKTDCIAPLAGDAYRRLTKASELYTNGYSKKIIISIIPQEERWDEEDAFRLRLLALKDISEKEFVVTALKYFGIDPKDIYITDGEVMSTYEEAVATKRFMTEKGLRSLILVTSTYHMRRALMIFRLVFRDSGIKVYNCTAPNILYDPHHWWRKEKDVKAISQEYFSIVHNIIYRFILKKGRTAFDHA